MPKRYDQEDVNIQREIQDIHTTLKDMGEEMRSSFKCVNDRLDGMNGFVKSHEKDINGMRICLENHEHISEEWVKAHLDAHRSYEDGLSKRVSFYSIGGTMVGAVVAAGAMVMAWVSGLFKSS